MLEGPKYSETKQLPLKEIAKKAKKEILQAHPEIKVSIRTRDYNAIDVEITAIPEGFQALQKIPADQNYPYPTIRHSDKGQQLINDIENILDAYNRKDIEIETDYCNVRFFTYVTFSHQIIQEAQKLLA